MYKSSAAHAGRSAAQAHLELLRAVRGDRHGDTILAQISPQEAALLKARGGAGVRNPHTGLLQFYINGNGPNGSMQGGVGGNSTAGSHAGNAGGSGGTHGGDAANAGRAAASAHAAAISLASTGQMPSSPGGQVAGGPPAGTQTNTGLYATGRLTPYGAPIRVNSLGVETALSPSAWNSWQDQVNTYNAAAKDWNARPFLERAANFVAPFGFGEVAPNLNRPKTYTGGTYHAGWNPFSAVAGTAGSLLGGPLAGFAAGQAGALLGEGNEVMLGGPSVPNTWDPKGATPYQASQAYSPFTAGGNPTNGGQPAIAGPVQQVPTIFGQAQGTPAPKKPKPAVSIFPQAKPKPYYSPIMGGSDPYGVWLYPS